MKRFFSAQPPRISAIQTLVTALVYAILALAIPLITYREMQQSALREAEARARMVINRNLAIHAFFNRELKPAIFAVTEASLDPAYFDPVWMSSTYAVREIDAIFAHSGTGGYTGYYYKEAAVNARDPLNEADPAERAFLEALNANPSLAQRSEVRRIDGVPYLEVMQRGETMEASCLRCHSTPEASPSGLVRAYGPDRSFHRQEGEVISAVSIRIPLAQAFQQADLAYSKIAVLLMALLLGLFAAQTVIVRRLVLRPLDRLRSAALGIAGDERRLGEQIALPFGRELTDLALSFNRMSASLRAQKDGLEARVTERTGQLDQSRRLIQNILDLTPGLLFLFDATTGRFHYTNHAVALFFGVSEAAFIEQGEAFLLEHIHPGAQAAYARLRSGLNAARPHEIIEGRVPFRNHQGEYRLMALRAQVVSRGAGGQPELLLFNGEDVTEAAHAEERLRYTSTHDGLTGLLNWSAFQEAMHAIRAPERERETYPVGMIIMDVDNLKQINDTAGHAAGDEMLRRLSGVLLGAFRDQDVVARVGGDEFAALVCSVTEAEVAQVVKRVRARLKESTPAGSMRLDVLSIGTGLALTAGEVDAAFQSADRAMYADKLSRKEAGG